MLGLSFKMLLYSIKVLYVVMVAASAINMSYSFSASTSLIPRVTQVLSVESKPSSALSMTHPTAAQSEPKAVPKIIQGGMGVRISSWRLAREVSKKGGLGVVSGTAMDVIFVRTLQDGELLSVIVIVCIVPYFCEVFYLV